jgi:hypothetical protein
VCCSLLALLPSPPVAEWLDQRLEVPWSNISTICFAVVCPAAAIPSPTLQPQPVLVPTTCPTASSSPNSSTAQAAVSTQPLPGDDAAVRGPATAPAIPLVTPPATTGARAQSTSTSPKSPAGSGSSTPSALQGAGSAQTQQAASPTSPAGHAGSSAAVADRAAALNTEQPVAAASALAAAAELDPVDGANAAAAPTAPKGGGPLAASANTAAFKTPAAVTRAQQQQQPKSPLTFDDLLPLLTSQHRSSSSNNDALMDLYDAFTRQGEITVMLLVTFVRTEFSDSFVTVSTSELNELRRSLPVAACSTHQLKQARPPARVGPPQPGLHMAYYVTTSDCTLPLAATTVLLYGLQFTSGCSSWVAMLLTTYSPA